MLVPLQVSGPAGQSLVVRQLDLTALAGSRCVEHTGIRHTLHVEEEHVSSAHVCSLCCRQESVLATPPPFSFTLLHFVGRCRSVIYISKVQ